MKICFVATNAYPLLSGKATEAHVGGAELQQVQIARGLARRGWAVSFVTRDFGQGPYEEVDGIKVFATYRKSHGLPILRFFYPRLTKLWGALKQADADLYYTRTASFLPAVLRIFCRKYDRKYCFAGALDADFEPGNLPINTARDRMLYRYGLRRADLVTVQSMVQQRLAEDNFGVSPQVLKNFLPPADDTRDDGRDIVLWVATIRKRKDPMRFVELAKRCPEHRFVMIGGELQTQPELYETVASQSAELDNLDFLGFRSFPEVEGYFKRARVFVNTSSQEGFPNTFLQAWRRGVPVVSFLDPDGVINGHHLGTVVHNDTELAEAVRRWWSEAVPSQSIIDTFQRHLILSYSTLPNFIHGLTQLYLTNFMT
ncbi:MAG: glycosyltransferase family 4 protein [Pseudomonadota bacterium]